MLQPFSEYLKKNSLSSKPLSIEMLRSYALVWFAEILNFTWIMRKKFFSLLMIPLFRGGPENVEKTILYNSFQDHINKLTAEKFIDTLDNLFIQEKNILEKNAISYLSKNPFNLPENFYPFPSLERNNGVQMICRLRLADDTVINLPNSLFARSSIGVKAEEKKTIRDLVRANINSCEWLKTALVSMQLPNHLHNNINLNEPHAEDVWFTTHSQTLIDQLTSRNITNETVSDFFNLSYLIGARIEFVISSSPCDTCKVYFQALRKDLNTRGIQLPIVIFANRHTNTDEKDCGIFIVNRSGEYQALPSQWNGELIRERTLTQHVSAPVNLSDTYRTVLILQIFGDALLPRLAQMKPVLISAFLSGLLESSSTNHLMVDWVRYYFNQALSILSFDLSPTTTKRNLLKPDNYKIVDYNFLTSSTSIPGIFEYAKELVKLAVAHPDHAIGFFLLICRHWNNMNCGLLTDGRAKKVSDLSLSPELTRIAKSVRDATTWDLKSAPKDVLYLSEFSEEKHVSVSSNTVMDLSRLLNSTWEFIHFLSIDPKYQRNILNALFTHPMQSPLGEENTCWTDKGITTLIEFTIKAIKILAFKNDRWNMQVIERIFNAFRNKYFDEELDEIIINFCKNNDGKHLPLLPRTYSVEQVISSKQVWTISVKHSNTAEEKDTSATYKVKLQDKSKEGTTIFATDIANQFSRKNIQTLLSEFSLFRKLHDDYITEHRHDDPKIQREHDKRFGLIII